MSWATTGIDPKVMGIGPVTASQAALKKAGWTVKGLATLCIGGGMGIAMCVQRD